MRHGVVLLFTAESCIRHTCEMALRICMMEYFVFKYISTHVRVNSHMRTSTSRYIISAEHYALHRKPRERIAWIIGNLRLWTSIWLVRLTGISRFIVWHESIHTKLNITTIWGDTEWKKLSSIERVAQQASLVIYVYILVASRISSWDFGSFYI